MYRYIVAMSFDREKVRDILISSSEKIIEHLIKILYYPNSDNVDHWKIEVYSFLNRVPKLKGSNKWPSKKFILSSISGYNDAIEAFTNPVIHKYGTPETNIPDSEIVKAIESYQDYLSSILSAQGYILDSDIYSKIDDIVSKYS